MSFNETAFHFTCKDSCLLGIVHRPTALSDLSHRGVLIVVGGPQYRVGSHRQFLLTARHLAQQGVATMRFDYRGMGDSDGTARDFESIQADIGCAIDSFIGQVPEINEIVIWGLCDAASAAAFYASSDTRVKGLVLLNPWVRTEEGIAKAYLKHYYISRLTSADFWRKCLSGNFQLMASLNSLFSMLGSALGLSKVQDAAVSETQSNQTATPEHQTDGSANVSISTSVPLPERVFKGLSKFNGKLLFILSGDDLTADEFRDVVKGSRQWRKLLSQDRVTQQELTKANHTFSQRNWRDQVASWTSDWVKSI